jgi:chromodomain-helicase-DNA-binding protein 1
MACTDDIALASFPLRKDKADSSDEDYGTKSHKKKVPATARKAHSGQTSPDGLNDADAAWRRGAAKKVVTYDEAQVDYGLASEEEEDAYYQAQEAGLGGPADEVDQVLSHSRDEDHLADPVDIPQENLVSSAPCVRKPY